MVFRWLKGLSAKEEGKKSEPQTEKRSRGLSTIDLNPFGSLDQDSAELVSETLVMPEFDDGETEVWQSLDSLQSEPPGPLHEEPLMPSAHSDHNELPNTPFIIIPSLRAMANRLRLEAQSGGGSAAVGSWRAYLQLVPSDSGAWLSLGEHHLEHGELDDAKRVFTKAVEKQPEDGISMGALGHTLLMLGEISEARRCLEEACHQLPSEIGLQEALLTCLKTQGDADAVQRQASFIEDLRRGS